MPTYRPAGEDAPNALMAQAAFERRMARVRRPRKAWVDPIRPGWPGPQVTWTAAMTAVFDRAYADALSRGLHQPQSWAEGYRAVTLMSEGRMPTNREES